jgi:hypothetical protein
MAEVLVLEFSSPNALELYRKASEELGIDPETHHGDWPEGMMQHTAGVDGDTLIVVETWNSRAEQETFMHERLGPALESTGALQPGRVVWLSQVGAYHTH